MIAANVVQSRRTPTPKKGSDSMAMSNTLTCAQTGKKIRINEDSITILEDVSEVPTSDGDAPHYKILKDRDEIIPAETNTIIHTNIPFDHPMQEGLVESILVEEHMESIFGCRMQVHTAPPGVVMRGHEADGDTRPVKR